MGSAGTESAEKIRGFRQSPARHHTTAHLARIPTNLGIDCLGRKLLDIATADATWRSWSQGQFRAAAAQGPILINPIIYAELAPAFASQSDLDRWLDPAVFQRLPLPYGAGWLAAQAFVKYRRAGGY